MSSNELSLDEWWTDLINQKDEEIAILKEKLDKKTKMMNEHALTVDILRDRSERHLYITQKALVDIVNYTVVNDYEKFLSDIARSALNKIDEEYKSYRKNKKQKTESIF